MSEKEKAVTVSPYCVLRNGTAPEVLHAATDEEAWEQVRKQVRMGKQPVIYLFKMIGAEVYTPSSTNLTLDEIFAGEVPKRTRSLDVNVGANGG